jgi:hypothetical protein
MKKLEQLHVTKEMAQAWLDKRHGQRPVVRSAVEQYRRDMDSGAWRSDAAGSPILITAEGQCIGGQHRLEALVKSRMPGLLMWVLTNADVVDRQYAHGRAETLRDRVVQFSETQIDCLAANRLIAIVRHHEILKTRSVWFVSMSIRELEEATKELREALIAVARKMADSRKYPAHLVASFVYAWHLLPLDRPVVEQMVEDVITQVGLKAGSPSLAIVQYKTKRLRMDTTSRTKFSLAVLRAIRCEIDRETTSGLQVVDINWKVADWMANRSQAQNKAISMNLGGV